jgi:hypothetical protein
MNAVKQNPTNKATLGELSAVCAGQSIAGAICDSYGDEIGSFEDVRHAEILVKEHNEYAALILAVDNFLAEGRPHGGRNTQFPDGCECDICQNWDTLNRERQAIGAKP